MVPSAGGGEIPGFSVETGISLISTRERRFGYANNPPNQALARQFP
jgi:hypothetical protein